LADFSLLKERPGSATSSPRDVAGARFLSRKQIILAGLAAPIFALAALWFGVSRSAAAPSVEIFPFDHTMGSPNAPVVLVEYAAPSCPFCARFNAEVLPKVKRDYIDTGKVRYVLRVYPISPVDGAAEGIAGCLPADNYFAFIDLLFRNQKQWDPEYGVKDVHGALVRLGAGAGLSADKVDHCIADRASADRINEIAQDGVTKYNIRVVPTLVINGAVQSPGLVPWPTLHNTLEKFLSRN
jgi:protein-disulfide isomerase